MTHLGKVLARLLNSRFSTKGNQIDNAGRVATSYFMCLGNLMKHFVQHFAVKDIDFTIVPLEMLMKNVKVTSKVVLLLAPYAEEAQQEDIKQAAKEKKKPVVVKECKFETGLVRAIGNFSKTVQKLDGQTKRDFSKFVYTGDVRDFRINMQKAGDLTNEESDDQVSASDSEEDEPIRKRSRVVKVVSSSENEDSDATDVSKEIQLPVRRGGFEENVKKLGTKATKRKRK
jgi:hypothetical protein